MRSIRLATTALTLALSPFALSAQESPGSATTDVDELESHLRDEMADLRRVGLSDDEAFLIAVGRLGEPGIRTAVGQAMKIRGGQVVFGRTIDEALENHGAIADPSQSPRRDRQIVANEIEFRELSLLGKIGNHELPGPPTTCQPLTMLTLTGAHTIRQVH